MTKFQPIDVHRILSGESGFTCDRPALSSAELAALVAFIEPPPSAKTRSIFEAGVQRIFALAVSGLLNEARYAGTPVKSLRAKARRFVVMLEKTEAAIDCLDPGLSRLIDAELARQARTQKVERITPKSSIDVWQSKTTDLIGLIIGVARQLELSPVQGERCVVYRQMVRGLAGLVHAATGEVPKRRTKRKTIADTSVDDYWFLRLAQTLGEFAFAEGERRVEQDHAAAESAAETGEDGKAIKPSGKSHNRTKPNTKRALPTRKIIGPPPLTTIVREELKALHDELASPHTRFMVKKRHKQH